MYLCHKFYRRCVICYKKVNCLSISKDVWEEFCSCFTLDKIAYGVYRLCPNREDVREDVPFYMPMQPH